MAGQLTDAQISLYKETFALIDTDKDGKISRQELQKLVQIIRLDCSDREITEMMDIATSSTAPAKGEKKIEFKQFLEVMVRKPKGEDDEEIKKQKEEELIRTAFDVFDRDQDGIISEKELREVFELFGEKVTELEVYELLGKCDLDSDGKITLADFQALLKQTR
eukprot:TRINITY_DN6652_c0_g1_i1.p1 TRINITY_DN6652_c0_g1~~TRINITY_DN6652_c0_g1_i1.p1  ORF type:complete len:177 (-),score=70.05 TRINITY_DN6652_c0_g1_i1:168-659(-)